MSHYTRLVGLRYGFSRQRSRFTTLVSLASMLGMALGVASLITVLSVMNGFASELRGRILALVPHAYVDVHAAADAGVESRLENLPEVLTLAPFRRETALLSGPYGQQGVVLMGMDPQRQGEVTELDRYVVSGTLADLEDPFTVILGSSLARSLGVIPGDDVQVILPRVSTTPLGVFPRTRLLRIVGLFEVGAQQDSVLAYLSLQSAERLLGRGGVSGLQLRTRDLLIAPRLALRMDALLGSDGTYRPWSETQGSLFRAIRMEKLTVSLLLLGVVFVAAFNVVSTLVMAVTEKRRDIAVLRTMGATPAEIATIFLTQGMGLALFGVGLGVATGVLLALNIADVVASVEAWVGQQLFDPQVYFISRLPAQLLMSDVLAVAAAAAVLSFVAAAYPAWRASCIAPAEVLRYE